MSSFYSSSADALLVFVDIVDSSVYSTILGIKRYAEKVLKFQKLFKELGTLYFPDQPYFKEPVDSWRRISSRGDEGLIFIVNPRQEGSGLVHTAVKFAFELKARLKMLNKIESDTPPKDMKIAVGIHYGEVALVSKPESKDGIKRTFIDKIIGYSINYAKRVEASARIGKYSQIFLSKEASGLLYGFPIVLHKHVTSLKGIQENEEVFEIQSSFLPDIPIHSDEKSEVIDNEQFLNFYTEGFSESEFLRDSWLKSFVLSVLDSRRYSIRGNSLKKLYTDKIAKFAWNSPIEDDPILLYWRAKECQISNKLTRAATYFKEIIERYPDFIHARIKLVDVCYQIINSKGKISSEKIFVRDTAEEFLEKYNSILSEKERRNFEDILRNIGR